MFGLSTDQTAEAGSLLQEMTVNWRELLAGSEGFLTGKDQRGLYRHPVVWGEMVASHRLMYSSAMANAAFSVVHRIAW